MRTLQTLSTLIAAAALGLAARAQTGGTMNPSVDLLDFRVLDAEYSRALERIVAVSGTPANQLHVYDPINQTDVAVALPLAPRCVSVAPDGLTAAVGYDGWTSWIDLAAGTVIQHWPVSTIAVDIVLAGNGFVYVFPLIDQWERIRCIELATGTETLHTGNSIRAGTLARLHPGGTSIYGADNGLSPSDIEKYSITPGTAQYLYDSPYHGTYAMCGDLWISDDGFRIFTRCSNVFRASDVPAEDMVYAGSMSNVGLIEHLGDSALSGKIVLIPEGATLDRKIQIYDSAFLGFEEEVDLPGVPVGAGSYASHGRFVFLDGNATKAFVVLTVDASSGLLLDSGVATYDFPAPCSGSTSSYCATKLNSTGAAAELEITGSLSIASNDTWLGAKSCPPKALGLFIFGDTPGQLPFGDGTLCIGIFGSGIKRPWSPITVGADGTVAQQLDFTTLPGNAQFSGGATRYFQMWFRDPAGPGGTGFNLTDGVQATFCN